MNKLNQQKVTQIFQNGKSNNKKAYSSKLKPDTDYELNWMLYKDALIYDKRTNCEYYGSLI